MSQLRVLYTLLILLILQATASADVNVLIVGSNYDSSDHPNITANSAAFSPDAIATELQSILAGANLGTVNVTVEERFTGTQEHTNLKILNAYFNDTVSCYNLASWFHYPYPADVETTTRWPNLRGENGTNWDYVVLIGDPYTIENLPGLYAYGVGEVAEEVAKGNAETILLMPWPAAGSTSTVAHYKDIVYRTGRSGGLKVAPGALAWQAAGSPVGATHPSANGAYIAAASIYSRIYNQSATNSTYVYNDTLADTVHSEVVANIGAPQYTGEFVFQDVFQRFKRKDRSCEPRSCGGGASTEARFQTRTLQAQSRCGVSGEGYSIYYGRQIDKDNRSYGQYYTNAQYTAEASTARVFVYPYHTTRDNNDIHISRFFSQEVTVSDKLMGESSTYRILPRRLIWAQIHKENPSLFPAPDGTHLNDIADIACGAYSYTIVSDRCPVDPKPDPITDEWLAQKIGYETAWRLSHCQTRAPGFKVTPSSVDRLSLDANTTETMTVQFLLPPQSNVTVDITLAGANQVTLDTNSLTFTPENYATPQTVTITNPGSNIAENNFEIRFSTSSDDPVYDGLYDSWGYTENGTFIQPENPYYTVPGVEWELFNGVANYSGLDALTPDATGIKSSLTVAPPGEESTGHFAVRFTGYLDVPVSGIYSLTTESTGDIRLYLGDTLVAENTQNQVPRTQEAAIAAGTHAMTVLYWYDEFRSPSINLWWEVPGDIIRSIPDSALSRIPPNTAPVAYDGSIAANVYSETRYFDLVATDIDNPQSDLVYTVVTQPESGTVSVPAGPSVIYSPEPGFEGYVSFTYKVSDGDLDSNIARIFITVGNPPVARAGVDQTVRDNDDNGSEVITLDGSGSYDVFGSIVSYVWNDGTTDIASNATGTANVPLPLGTHTITLTVTDNDGFTDTDTVVITVEDPNMPPVVSAGQNQFAVLEESAPGTPVPSASGGAVTDYRLNGMNYTTHTFTSSGTLTVSGGGDVEYLIVGGGGGGGDGHNSNGRRGGGGGGAGGLLTNVDGSMRAVTDGAYNVVVGSGGAAGATEKSGSNGSNSSFDGITAVGGGGGAGVWTHPSGAGGSGGGASSDVHTPGNGTAGQGHAGGLGTTSGGASNRGGGGGGAGESGSTDASGYGGDGVQNSITGANIWYAGGGAGGAGTADGPSSDRIGGLGGGGNSRQAGTDGLGGGGGGGHYGRTGKKGGSGIVIVRYATGTNVEVQFDGATATDGDGDDLDVSWEVVSTDPPGLPDPVFSGDVTLDTAAATFTAIGKYTLRLTGSDGTDTRSSSVDVFITDGSTAPPTAVAGDPQTVTDTDRSGGEDVTLDGSGSSDPDGTIDSYVWNDGTSDITTGVAPTVTLPVGTHTLTLTVTDNDGLPNSDTVVIRVNAPPLADAGADKQAILGAASPAWTPSEIAPAAWYDASDTGSITAAIDGKVSQWNDKSDNGRNATQTTELKQPTSGGDIGGSNALYFDGSDDTMSFPALGLTDDAMMICVYAPNNDSSGYSVMGNQTEANDNHDVLGGSGATYPHHFRTDRIQDVALGIPTSGANMLAHMADSGASEYRIRLNGSDTYLNSGAFTFADNVDQIGGTFITFLDGWVGEVIILNDYSLINMQKAEGYLAHKWGLTGNLPVGHPYKDSAPDGSGPAAAVTLSDATVSDADEGASLSQSWTLVSKPAGAADPDFSSSTALKPTVTFTASGTYELRLTADDTFETHSDDVIITIDPPLPTIYATWANGDNFANPFNNPALDADPDGDGVSSLLEFAFGTDPTANDSRFMAADGSTHGQPMAASDESDGMWLYYLRRTDHGTAGSVTFSTEFSTDLSSFTPSSTGLVPADVQNASPGYQVMKIPYPAESRFGRVAVEATPE